MSKNDIFKIVPTLSGQKWRVFKSNLDALTVLSVLDTGLQLGFDLLLRKIHVASVKYNVLIRET